MLHTLGARIDNLPRGIKERIKTATSVAEKLGVNVFLADTTDTPQGRRPASPDKESYFYFCGIFNVAVLVRSNKRYQFNVLWPEQQEHDIIRPSKQPSIEDRVASSGKIGNAFGLEVIIKGLFSKTIEVKLNSEPLKYEDDNVAVPWARKPTGWYTTINN